MRKTFLFNAIFCAIIILTGCNYKCPKADYSVLDWFPYETEQTFIMNGNEKEQHFTVDEIFFDHQDGYPAFTKCGACYNFFSVKFSTPLLSIETVQNNNEPSIETLKIEIYYNNGENYEREMLNFAEFLDTAKPMAVFKAADENQNFRTIIFEKNVGIISIETKYETITLQNPTEKSNTKNKILKISSCG